MLLQHSPPFIDGEKQVSPFHDQCYSTAYCSKHKKTASAASLEPWFPPHLQRNIYLSLLHIEPSPGQEKAPTIPDSVLKAALLQRACEDIRRVLMVRNAKQPLSTLLQRGSVGDELWQRFQRAEKEVEAELRDVVEEVRCLFRGAGAKARVLNKYSRQMHFSRGGARLYSSPRTKWYIMPNCERS